MLALILVKPLDLNVKERFRIDDYSPLVLESIGKYFLIGKLNLGKLTKNLLVVRIFFKLLELQRRLEIALADSGIEQLAKCGI